MPLNPKELGQTSYQHFGPTVATHKTTMGETLCKLAYDVVLVLLMEVGMGSLKFRQSNEKWNEEDLRADLHFIDDVKEDALAPVIVQKERGWYQLKSLMKSI